MKVKYIGKDKESDFFYDKVYNVLSLEIHNNEIFYRLISEEYIFSIVENSSNFKVVDNAINHNWVIKVWEDGFVEMSPESWQEESFWEKFYDFKIYEIKIYFDEIIKMFPNDTELIYKIQKESKRF